jgi:hypothetical protein
MVINMEIKIKIFNNVSDKIINDFIKNNIKELIDIEYSTCIMGAGTIIVNNICVIYR